MSDQAFVELLLLLGLAVGIVIAFQRLRIPSSLGYLLVGVLLGPYTIGPVLDGHQIRVLAEFGIVFLLFTIGLSFSLPQLHAMRHLLLGLGTGQVLLTTAIIGAIAWLAGLPPAAAFVVGAVFAQSSTTIITRQLLEQNEDQSRHGTLGTAMSVFQDVTAVPFVVVIPVLGLAAAHEVAGPLAWALAKAVLAFGLVFLAGRWLLHPLFHTVAARRSAELFTLTVLFVSLAAAWTTHSLGLSLAFGAFLAGMMLGETEFRHQVESTIRPFRDVLLGLFFVSIGMLFDPTSIPQIWHWVLLAALTVLVIKVILVAQIVRWAGIDPLTAWRTGILLGVGGEFGFALLAIALEADVLAEAPAQIALTTVLFSMIVAPFLIRYNHELAARVVARPARPARHDALRLVAGSANDLRDHAIICGYGRIGQSVGHFLEEEKIPYVAVDLDPTLVHEARVAGEPVYYGDATERDIIEALGVAAARLVVISHEDVAAAYKILHHVQALRPGLPVLVRTRDENHVEALRRAGATEVVPETLEAGMMIASHALLLLDVPLARVTSRTQAQRTGRYRLLREFFRADDALAARPQAQDADRLLPVPLPPGCRAVGRALSELDLDGVIVTALTRNGKRELGPPPDTRLEAGDVIVLLGPPADLQRVEARLLG
jgi:monovalent cation:H+ antiporter-2, CPA2 family